MARSVMCILFILSAFASWTSACTDADAEERKPARMDEVVVTAPPIAEGNRVDRLGSQVTTVTEDQISDLNAQDFQSAVRMVPGVIISRQNTVGSFGGGDGGAIYIRGMGSSRPGGEIQMAVDGIPKVVGVWTHPLMDIMSVDQAQRIDIYKGAQPVLFGNGAYGVVNLVTKRQVEEGFHTNIRAGYGSYSTFIEGVEHGGKVGKTDYYLFQGFRSSSGHRDHSSGELQEYFARVGHQINGPWYMSLTANATNNFAEDPGPEGNPAARQGTYRSDDEMGVITIAHQYSSAQGTVKLYWNRGTGDWQDQFDTAGGFHYDTVTDWDNYGGRLQEVITPWKNGEILGGIDLDFIGGKATIDRDATRPDSTFPRETFRILSPYAALSHLFGEKSGWHVIPSAGVRYFSHSDFDAEWGPQTGFIMGYGQTEFHASYAKGVNYPGVYVVTQSNLFWGGNGSWKDLDAETVDHYEAGLSHAIGKKFRADIICFTDDGKNRMILVTSPLPPRYENIGDFRLEGVEATATWAPLDALSFFAGATYLFKREPYNLPYAPYWSASTGLNYRFLRSFKLSLDALYVDNRYTANNRTAGYGGSSIADVNANFLVNAKLGWEFSLKTLGTKGEIYIAGENLTDESYAFKKDYPMPGITGMAGLNLKF
ncbi:MAG TPA: TonB-dependent receptor plug domain-containing protein [Syntrophales bacterium]|nr:TonB-dependent receptor plug domain-containing protein [Syntrophales bacterium]HOX95037.1 TonB-dependent receptor plug domain-containing protein [Syntrophales bacterium]HPI58484.1 TonB-dependent receptor plug domain-containing protein [Syntrophales bacterium]HPN26215.1 TonB-dependent receptor plug domain-containing protein [Syntrophales bacterium]HQM30664.1 TonB-dependent receptor plug domain-containing protein [Syntrophales bacterium]